jgi:hypothetical protein
LASPAAELGDEENISVLCRRESIPRTTYDRTSSANACMHLPRNLFDSRCTAH